MEGRVKFHYFIVNARGAVSRAILDANNVEYESVTFDFTTWPAAKASGAYEFGQLPLLEWGNKTYSQSHAIEIFLARKFSLLGSNEEDEAKILSLLLSYDDLYPKFRPAAFAFNDTEKEALSKKESEFLEKDGPFFLNIYENRFKTNGGEFVVGNKFSLADIYVGVILYNIFLDPKRREKWEPVFVKTAPQLYAHVLKLKENQLAKFFAKNYFNNTF